MAFCDDGVFVSSMESGSIDCMYIPSMDELKDSIARDDNANFREELGDLLFSVINLARFKGESAEDLLRNTIQKFHDRFRYMETESNKSDLQMNKMTLEELEALWQSAKEK